MTNRKLIKNSVVVFLVLAVLIIGTLTWFFFSTIDRRICRILFLIFVILSVAYERVRKLSVNKTIGILSVSLLNLFFIAYQIIKYPRVISYTNWGFFPNKFPKNDQFLGLDYHPLIMVFLIYSLTLIWYNRILKKNEIEKYYKITNWIVLYLVLIVGIIVLNNIEYEICRG